MAITIPSGGTIRETVNWDAIVPSSETFNFYIFSIYGHDVDGTPENFSAVFSEYIQTGEISSISRTDNLDVVIPSIPLDTYDCLTIVGDFDGSTIYTFDYVIDSAVLTIEAVLGATIISTSFSAV